MLFLIILLTCSTATAEEQVYTNADVHRAVHESRQEILFSTSRPFTPIDQRTNRFAKFIRERMKARKRAEGRIVCGKATEEQADPKAGHQEVCIEYPDQWRNDFKGGVSGTPA